MSWQLVTGGNKPPPLKKSNDEFAQHLEYNNEIIS